MKEFIYRVCVFTDTREHADTVMIERIAHDEDLGFDYEIDHEFDHDYQERQEAS